MGINDLREIDRMTISEYELRLKVYRLKKLDEQEVLHQQAWANWQIQATKAQGKKEVPVYRKFQDFFDKEKFENEILGVKTESQVDKNLLRLMKKANE